MHCTQCGQELPQESRFCSRCGAAVNLSQQQPEAVATPEANAQAAGQAPGQAPGQPGGYGPVYGAGPGAGYAQGYPGGYGPGVPPPVGYAGNGYAGRVAQHIQTLALLWGVFAGYRFLTKFFGLSLFHAWSRHAEWARWGGGYGWGNDWMGSLMPLAITTLLFWTALAALTAYGLSSRQPWARGLALVCGVWALIHPFLGTALGIYTLWVLAPSLSGMEYDRLSRPEQA